MMFAMAKEFETTRDLQRWLTFTYKHTVPVNHDASTFRLLSTNLPPVSTFFVGSKIPS